MELLSVIAGLLLLAGGGELIVRSAVSIARRFGLSALVIGVTVVAMATSMPELAVSVESALIGSPGVALGNVVGSNIANIALGLGVMAALVPFTARRDALRRDTAALLLASAGLMILGSFGRIERLWGIGMLVILGAHLWSTYSRDRRERDATAVIHASASREYGAVWPASLSFAALLASTGALVVGARLLLDGAAAIAMAWGVSDAVIGASIVAVGTSLPEIATTAVAALHREHDVALGNLVGSSLFNLFAILGVTSVVRPIPVDTGFLWTSGVAMLAVTVLAAPLLTGRLRVRRATGIALGAAYIIYVASVTGLIG